MYIDVFLLICCRALVNLFLLIYLLHVFSFFSWISEWRVPCFSLGYCLCVLGCDQRVVCDTYCYIVDCVALCFPWEGSDLPFR